MRSRNSRLRAGTAKVLIASSEQDSDLYYATRFLAPDPIIYAEIERRKYLILNELEVDRGKSEARVDEVLCASDLLRKNQKGFLAPLILLLKRWRIHHIQIPYNFPSLYARALESKGFRLDCSPDPLFFNERMVKSDDEIAAIRATQRALEKAVRKAVDLLAEARIADGRLDLGGEVLTSERLRTEMDLELHRLGFLASHTIVASGPQACDPHCRGIGPIRPHQALVIDIFPRSIETRYFSDMTRTFVKGRPSNELTRLYNTVLDGQKLGLEAVRAGVDGSRIHEKIMSLFSRKGYSTGLRHGRMQGFFHGTGHGVGLDIHEPPRLSKAGRRLRERNVVTVEPGLYYPDIGGVRIEDTVVVTKTGCENLADFPKDFVIP